jgi:hypothetical protein
MRDIGVVVDSELFSEAEQLRRIWGASLGTARRNEKARQQRLKDERSKATAPKTPEAAALSGSDLVRPELRSSDLKIHRSLDL